MHCFRWKKTLGLFVVLGLASVASLTAQEYRPVYLVREAGQNEVWTANMGLQTEALRYFVPVAFERKGRAVSLAADIPHVSFRSGRETQVSRAAGRVVVRYEVAVIGAPPLPKADRSRTLRFTLDELNASAAGDADTPGTYAIRQAVLTGAYTKGQAWIQSIDFKDKRFTVRVGLKRG